MQIVRYRKNSSEGIGCINKLYVHDFSHDLMDNLLIGDKIHHLDSVEIIEPCRPGKIIAVAHNFLGKDQKENSEYEPSFFLKPSTSVCGPGTIISNPFPGLPMWGEPELAVVVKNRLNNATINDVKSGILGFTIANDLTVENIYQRDHHLARSKCPDKFCPIGPWIDTEFDPTNCLIEGIQNGHVVRSGNVKDQIWQWPKILQSLSNWITLEPWDVILTGNPPDFSGGMETSSPGMRFLENGDNYTVRIQGLGELTNRFLLNGHNNFI